MMGYNLGSLVTLFDLVDRGHVPRGGRIFDLGSQDVYFQSADHVDILQRMIATSFPNLHKPSFQPTALTFPARELMDYLGFDYCCSDVDEREKTVFLDLHAPSLPPHLVESFDLVTDHGTLEHVLDPLMTMAVTHALVRPRGIIWHHLPCFGLGNHGFINLTPKFWTALVQANTYAVMTASVRFIPAADLPVDQLYHPSQQFLTGVEGAKDRDSAMCEIILQRTNDEIFFPPLDFYVWESEATLRMLSSSITHYAMMQAWPPAKVARDVNALLLRCGSPWKVRADRNGDLHRVRRNPLTKGVAQARARLARRLRTMFRCRTAHDLARPKGL